MKYYNDSSLFFVGRNIKDIPNIVKELAVTFKLKDNEQNLYKVTQKVCDEVCKNVYGRLDDSGIVTPKDKRYVPVKCREAIKREIKDIISKYRLNASEAREPLYNFLVKSICTKEGISIYSNDGKKRVKFSDIIFRPSIRPVLKYVNINDVISALDSQDRDIIRTQMLCIQDLSSEHFPICSLSALVELINSFTEFLNSNEASIIKNGKPSEVFNGSTWLDKNLSCLYYTPNPPFNLEKEEEDDLFSVENSNNLIKIRYKLLKAKLHCLALIAKGLNSKLDNNIWDDCLKYLSGPDCLLWEDLNKILKIEDIYSPHCNAASQNYRPGGIVDIVAFLVFVMDEILNERMINVNMKLVQLDPRSANYVQFVNLEVLYPRLFRHDREIITGIIDQFDNVYWIKELLQDILVRYAKEILSNECTIEKKIRIKVKYRKRVDIESCIQKIEDVYLREQLYVEKNSRSVITPNGVYSFTKRQFPIVERYWKRFIESSNEFLTEEDAFIDAGLAYTVGATMRSLFKSKKTNFDAIFEQDANNKDCWRLNFDK